MSDLRINNITDRTGDRGPVIAGVSTVTSTGAFTVPVGPTEMRGGRGRGVFGGAANPSYLNIMDYVEIATTGNAADFGDLVEARNSVEGNASATRGLFGAGSPGPTNQIAGVTIASLGNAFDFGD